MPRRMPLPDPVPSIPDQPVLFNSRSLDIRLLSTLPDHDNDIDDVKQLKVTIRQTDKALYRKPSMMFDEI